MKYLKVYVGVFLYTDTDGRTKPVAIEWETGRRFKIDGVLSERMSPPQHVGAILTRRYEIKIDGRVKVLYLETGTNRWFVEKPVFN